MPVLDPVRSSLEVSSMHTRHMGENGIREEQRVEHVGNSSYIP